MSKKTFFRRLAISVIVALGMGFLTVSPSQAGITGHTLTIDSATDAITVGETATAVLTHSFVALSRMDSVTVSAFVSSGNVGNAGTLKLRLSDSSTSLGSSTDPDYASNRNSGFGGTSVRDKLVLTPNSAEAGDVVTEAVVSETTSSSARSVNTTWQLRLIAPKAGTYTVTVVTQSSDNGATPVGTTVTSTWTVTVSAKSTTAAASSTSTLRRGTSTIALGTAEGTDSAVTGSSSTSAVLNPDPAATIYVLLKNATSSASESLNVTVTGAGQVSSSSTVRPGNNEAKSVTFRYSGVSTGEPIYVWSDGTTGTSTITIKTPSGLTVGTETITFFGAQASISVGTAYKNILRAGGFSNSNIADVVVKDASGNLVSGLTVSQISSNDAVVTSGGTCDEDRDADPGYYYCTVSTAVGSTSGQTATLTYRVTDGASSTSSSATTYFTTTHDVSLGGSASTITLSITPAKTLEPGETFVLTATAVDSSGNPVYDGAAGMTTLTANKPLLSGSTITMNTYYGGKSTSETRSALDPKVIRYSNNLFAPATSGKFEILGRYGTDNTKSVTVTGTVGDDAATAAAAAASDAALEAIDAANAATDAANLAAEAADAATVAAEEARDAADAATAAVEALATEVATLMAALKAQITTLANTVAKIAKKVKA